MHRIIYHFHKVILSIALVLTVIAIILTTRLNLDLDLFALLPSNHPGTRVFFEVAEEIGFQSLLIALVEPPPGVDETESDAFVELFAENCSKSPLVHEVEYKSEDMERASLFRDFVAYLPLFLRAQDLDKLSFKLSDAGIRGQIQENKGLLMTPFGIGAKDLIRMDPLGFREFLEPTINRPSEKAAIRPHSGYYRTEDRRIYFMFLKPVKPPQDVVFSKKLMEETRHIEKATFSEFAARFGRPAEPVKVSYTGGYAIAVSDEATTKRDIQVTVLTSFVGVMILFALSFRTARILLFVAIPLAVSLIWTLGFASLAFHRINLLACIFSCVLIGLGIDFAIHMINRFFGPDKEGLGVANRLERTFQETGAGILVGGITTAVAFYSIAVSDFRGFKELGLLTGTGILLCLLAMIFVLPSLLVYFSKATQLRSKVSVAGFGLRPLLVSVGRCPKLFFFVTLLVIVLLGVLGREVAFDDNLRNFRPADDHVFRLQEKVGAWLGGSTAEVLLVSQGPSEAGVLETNARIYEALAELRESGRVAGLRSISLFFLPPSQQRKTIQFIRNHPDHFNMTRIRDTFYEALEENGFQRAVMYEAYLNSLGKALQTREPFLPSHFQGTGLDRFLKPFLFRRGESFKAVNYIAPPQDLWSQSDTSRFRDIIVGKLEERGVGSDRYQLTGPNVLTSDLKALIIRNLKSSLWLASLGIVLVLLIYYRNLQSVVLSILPLLLGLTALFGLMVLFGLDLNYFNLIVLPMIAGIGIDDGVHLTNTFRRVGRGEILEGLAHTGRAVVLTSLTTLVGFGSIALSHYPGLQSMGYVAVMGIGACLFASVLVLPALFTMIRGTRKA